MRRSLSQRQTDPVTSALLFTTGLAALVGGCIVVGVSVAEWLSPAPEFYHWRGLFEHHPRPYDWIALATWPCVIGAAGLLLPRARLVEEEAGILPLFGLCFGVALLGGGWSSFEAGAVGVLMVPLALARFGWWVARSGQYAELGPVPRVLGIAPIVIWLWTLALYASPDYRRFLYLEIEHRLIAAQFMAFGMNWFVIWWISWFGAPHVPVQAEQRPPATPDRHRDAAIARLTHVGLTWRPTSYPRSAARASST